MKTKRFCDGLVRITMAMIGMFLRFCSVVIWIPARIALGIADALRDVGESLTNYVVTKPAKPAVDAIEAENTTIE